MQVFHSLLIYFSLIAICFSCTKASQPDTIDTNSQNSSILDSAELWLERGDEMMYMGLPDSALACFEESVEVINVFKELSIATNHDIRRYYSLKGLSYASLGTFYANMGMLDKAINHYLKAETFLKLSRNKHHLTIVYNDLGVLYDYANSSEKSLDYFKSCVELCYVTNNKRTLALTFGNIGDLFNQFKAYDQALVYHQSALSIQKEIGDTQEMAMSHNYIGRIHLEQNKLQEAQNNFEASKKYSLAIGNDRNLARTYGCLGRVMLKTQKIDSAHHYFQEELRINTALKDGGGLCIAEIHLGQLYLKKSNPKEALVHLTRAYELAIQLEYNDFIQKTAKELSIAHQEMGNDTEGLFFYKLSDSLTAITKSVERKKNLIYNELKIKFEHDKLVYKANADKKLELKSVVYQKNRNFLLVTLCLVLIIGLATIYGVRQRQKLIAARLEVSELTGKELSNQLHLKLKELTSMSIRISQTNQYISQISAIVDDLSRMDAENADELLRKKLIEQKVILKDQSRMDKDWSDFQMYFDGLHKDFSKRLKSKFPLLSTHEIRLCSLMKLGLSTSEIATLLNLSSNTLNSARYRIHKKMNLEKGERLQDFILLFD